MPNLTVLKDGIAVPTTSSAPAVLYGYVAAARPGPANYRPDGLIQFLQWQDEGSNLGDNAARVVNFVANPLAWQATRGVGEHANVITLKKIP
jgi:hypothetical protein